MKFSLDSIGSLMGNDWRTYACHLHSVRRHKIEASVYVYIQKCEWKQVSPIPTSPQNTVLAGGDKHCLHESDETTFQVIDATLNRLKVPDLPGNYRFQLSCSDESGNTGTEHIDIWVNELLIPPTITVKRQDLRALTSVGNVKLEVSCEAVQGKIVKREWVYIDGPPSIDPTTPSHDGIFHFFMPGTYKFKYGCTDSYDGYQQRLSTQCCFVSRRSANAWSQVLYF